MNATSAIPLRAVLAATVLAAATAVLLAASAASSAPPGAAAYPACRTSQLTVWIGVPGNGAAGSSYYELELSNTSPSTCTLTGYPGVSALTGTGRQAGSAAGRDRSFAPATVVLTRGATAHAVLRVISADLYPAALCRPATVGALRIYPPNQTLSVVVPFSLRACTAAGPVYLTVRVVRPGTGIPGYSQ